MSEYVVDKFRRRFAADEVRFGVVREPVGELPIIDLSPFVNNGSDAEKRAVADQLREASINIGFFFLKNHGISQQEMDEALSWVAEIFDLPVAEKEKLHQKHSPHSHGWFPSEHENLQGTVDSKPDLKEGFSIGRELEPNDPMTDQPLMGPNPYPDDALPGFGPFIKKYLADVGVVGGHLLRAFALSLGFEETRFDSDHTHHFGFARMNYYPPVTEADVAQQQWSCGAHTDYEEFTLLLQDDVGGLEVCNSAGDWISVPVKPGMFVVNIGDLMSIWTNDLYASTPHRVRNVSGKKRYSFPYFYGPGKDASIECLETCQSPDNPPKYAPTDVITYNVAQVSQTHPVETLKEFRGFEHVGVQS